MGLANCYKLYSCDETIEPFYSSEGALSGFVDNYVVLNITNPETVSGQCFYVKYNNIGKCVDTKEFTIVYSGFCDCECNCYSFNTPSSVITTEYVNCDDQLITTTLPANNSFKFCAKTKPTFDYNGEIVVTNNGNCVNNSCVKPPITITPRNECDVLTIFPMEISCNVTHPTGLNAFDGTILLTITGGTPPYTISWENGSASQMVSGLLPGEYSATVSDFYGDFVLTSTCVLTGATPTPSPSPTPIPKPTPVYGPICVNIIKVKGETSLPTQTQFYQGEQINGKASWTGDSGNILMYWSSGSTPNYWTISGLTTIGQFINTNPATPPLIGWQSIGDPLILPTNIIVYSGICGNQPPITVTVNTINSECGKNGRLTITANGGVPSYQYSIDGGVTYSTSSVFNNLVPGTYFVKVKDSLGDESSVQSATIVITPSPTYSLTMSTTQISGGGMFTITPPQNLPPTETIQFKLTQVSSLIYYPEPTTLIPVQPTPSYNNVVTFTSPIGLGGMTLVTTQTQNTDFTTPGCNGGITQGITQTKAYTKTLTISGGQTISGTITDQIINPIPSNIKCGDTQGSYTLQISNARTLTCSCCPVTVINTPTSVNPNNTLKTIGGMNNKPTPPKL